jgi:N-acyl-L-homoserine lactone synthetase
MILVIDALNRHHHTDLVQQMFALRARVFARRLAWDVTVDRGQEIDEFDAFDPVYLVGLDDRDQVIACVRLIQTMGPHMLSDVFGTMLRGQPPLCGPTIWEASRLCVDNDRLRSADNADSAVARAMAGLVAAMLVYARQCGITDIILVLDPALHNILHKTAGTICDELAGPVQMGRVTARATLVACSVENLMRIQAVAGTRAAGLLVNAQEPLGRAAPRQTAEREKNACPTPAELEEYCLEQVSAASSLSELGAALNLADAVLPDHGFGKGTLRKKPPKSTGCH